MAEMLLRKIVDELAMEPEWTVEDDSGIGFVAGQLGTWLTVTGDPDRPCLRIEVRLTCGARTGPDLWSLYRDGLVLPRSLGRLVHDPHRLILSLVSDLPILGGLAAVRLLSGCVAELVYDGEAIIARHHLPGYPAVTLVDGRRRRFFHPLVGRSPRINGLRQDSLQGLNGLLDAPSETFPSGWSVQQEERAMSATGPAGEAFFGRVEYGRRTGWGLCLVARPPAAAMESRDAIGIQLQDLNRADAQLSRFAPGHWRREDQSGVEYRAVMSARLLSLVSETVPAMEEMVRAVAVRALHPTPTSGRQPALLRTWWPGDEDAVLLTPRRWHAARRAAAPAPAPEEKPETLVHAAPQAEDQPRETNPDRWTAARLLAHLGDDPTLVTSVAVRGKLTMIPRRTALWGADNQAKLAAARTYGEVRAAGWGDQIDDPKRHGLLDYYLDMYQDRNPEEELDDLTEEELWDIVCPSDDEPFTVDGHPAFDTTVSEYADSPEADLDLDTDSWMPSEVAARFGEVEGGYYAMPSREWEQPEFVYPAERRDEIEEALRGLGFTIIRDDGLIWFYLTG
ncbi:hypothetical protein SAMN05216276_10675 [Streptosporangium subroseum]|uniref:Uncharacterized protein n=1 Tax=Streptosporangium subroseum TaxID=106412 RepID=A0A239NSU2_9ACTN|nr:hypothetical protein [Streptosporangium subroseum]SNT57513.1 hypothetical protein SAMN05216276_10675 [Streptosporangium subroseum]